MKVGKKRQRSEDLRGEVLFGGYVNNVLLAKSRGETKDYDCLVQNLLNCQGDPEIMKKYVFGLKNCISSLTKECETLVGAVLLLPWLDKPDEIVNEFIDFLVNLVSSQTCYLHACLKMLIKHFSPYVVKGSKKMELDEKERLKRAKNTQKALQAIMEIVPTASAHMLPAIVNGYPFIKMSLVHHEFYVTNLLQLAEYRPSMHLDLLEVICNNLVKIDVEIPKYSLEKTDLDEITQFELDMECESKKENEKSKSTGDDMAEKLDILMNMMFEFLKNSFYVEDVFCEEYAWPMFDKVLEVFLKVVFPTHDCCHVQFFLFYICSFDEEMVSRFLEVCWMKFQDPNTPVILRQTAAAYIGSLIARAKYIKISMIKKCLNLLVSWIHRYIDNINCELAYPDVDKHGPFYSLCQAVFYIYVYRHSCLLQEKDGMGFARRLNFERIVTCKLNPLKICLSHVVKMFAHVTRYNEVVFCYTIIEKNNRSLPMTAPSFTSSVVAKHSQLNQLDSFFPFEPYLLKRSRLFIKDIYREWDGIEPETYISDGEEIDDHVELGKSPDSLPTSSLNSISDMKISP
ncbi:RNA polymerase I-specific transcription initiation factor RRN3-like [Xenia sp. Carnegie-2017]|uniref:RNA polymerase I-specific transcription initiation factor RRN3-like n=1 Tax=Xenia sp. Carnegie-2017 TaxID=2897299 RepID=UPI001F0361C5|nr:RNA polymerase I-specific transcription initiation factor RRN3-like [Xenia sp. Carnegie-2017]